MISYRELVNKSITIEKKLLKRGVIEQMRGRFKFYQNLITEMAEAWENKRIEEIHKKYTQLETGFALKEFRELVFILEQLLYVYEDLPSESKSRLKKNIHQILTGPNFTLNENASNSSARNTQFELRMASRFIQSGLKNIEFLENPDICLNVERYKYGIECKRVSGNSQRSFFSNIEEAIKQIEKKKNSYYVGVIALDLSPHFERGQNWLFSKSRESANKAVLDDLEKYVSYFHQRSSRLRKSAEEGSIIAILLDVSAVYLIPSEFGWMQETALLVMDKENPSVARRFMKGFSKLNTKE